MGRAIVREPQVFLMDEPLSNLDAKLRVQMRAEIAKLQHELGVTTIYVTHDQVEAMTMGDRVAVMSMGLLQQVDTPQRLYDEPANLFVASFIGTPPMNLRRGRRARGRRRGHGRPSARDPPRWSACARALPARRGAATDSTIVVGIRAEDLHPATVRPDLPTLDARIELVEALGSGLMAYFTIDAAAVRDGGAATPTDAAAEAGGIDGARPNLIAHFPPRVVLRDRRHGAGRRRHRTTSTSSTARRALRFARPPPRGALAAAVSLWRWPSPAGRRRGRGAARRARSSRRSRSLRRTRRSRRSASTS